MGRLVGNLPFGVATALLLKWLRQISLSASPLPLPSSSDESAGNTAIATPTAAAATDHAEAEAVRQAELQRRGLFSYGRVPLVLMFQTEVAKVSLRLQCGVA